MTKKQRSERNQILVLLMLFAAVAGVNALLSLPQRAQALAFIGVYLAAGQDVLYRALSGILRRQVFDEKFLMAIATIGAIVIGEYPEAVFVMLFFRTGELFEKVAVGNTRKSISALMNIRPDTARILREGVPMEIDAAKVQVGQLIMVYPGERIPLDSVIVEGESALDLSALTGESLPKDVGVGDAVMSGTVVLSGKLTLSVTHGFETSTASRILELVENSTLHKAPVETFITRFAKYYTPAVVFAALFTALIPPMFLGQWGVWVHRALVFLVVSCPCALVISVPLTFFSSIGGASKQGILVKGAALLEKLSDVRAVAFDKTGTLTHGNFTVVALYPEGIEKEELLELAALAEGYSDHPIAQSLRNAYGKELDFNRLGEIREQAGFGICAEIDEKKVLVGNLKLMQQAGIEVPDISALGTLVYIASQGVYLGAVLIADTIKNNAFSAIASLNKEGIATVMFTGDRREIGQNVAAQLGIKEVYTDLLPEDKVRALFEIQNKYRTVAFVGDGMNDAPVLAAADVGMAMGNLGSDAAIEAADIVLMQDDPLHISRAMSLSRHTRRIVRQNIVFALGVKFAVMLLALWGFENMWLASFADVGVSVITICNAMRTLRFRKS